MHTNTHACIYVHRTQSRSNSKPKRKTGSVIVHTHEVWGSIWLDSHGNKTSFITLDSWSDRLQHTVWIQDGPASMQRAQIGSWWCGVADMFRSFQPGRSSQMWSAGEFSTQCHVLSCARVCERVCLWARVTWNDSLSCSVLMLQHLQVISDDPAWWMRESAFPGRAGLHGNEEVTLYDGGVTLKVAVATVVCEGVGICEETTACITVSHGWTAPDGVTGSVNSLTFELINAPVVCGRTCRLVCSHVKANSA